VESGLRWALRQRTHQLHAQLDDSLAGPHGQVTDLPGYVRLLRTLHALHDAADGPLARWASTSPLAVPLRGTALPDRAPSYAADLAALGEQLPPRRGADEPATPGDPRGLALLYLLAGSAAGARVLLRGLPAAVPGDARRGLTDAAAPASSRLWRETCRLLGGDTVPERLHDATVAEARGVMAWLLDRTQPVAS
jgi:heme oxygenase